MARTPTPWFWEERNGWYVNNDGQRHHLGEHPQDAPPPRKHKGKWNAPQAIMQAFHELDGPRQQPHSQTSPQTDGTAGC